MIDARLPGLRRPLEPDPRRLRRGRRAVRARGAPERDRLRLLDHRPHPGGDRPPARVRPQLGPRPTSSGRTSTRSTSSCDFARPDLPRRLQGRQGADRRRPATAGWRSHLPWADLRRGWDFVSTGHGDVPWEDCFRDAQRDRLRRTDLDRVGGRRAWTAWSARPRRWPSSAADAIDPARRRLRRRLLHRVTHCEGRKPGPVRPGLSHARVSPSRRSGAGPRRPSARPRRR